MHYSDAFPKRKTVTTRSHSVRWWGGESERSARERRWSGASASTCASAERERKSWRKRGDRHHCTSSSPFTAGPSSHDNTSQYSPTSSLSISLMLARSTTRCYLYVIALPSHLLFLFPLYLVSHFLFASLSLYSYHLCCKHLCPRVACCERDQGCCQHLQTEFMTKLKEALKPASWSFSYTAGIFQH